MYLQGKKLVGAGALQQSIVRGRSDPAVQKVHVSSRREILCGGDNETLFYISCSKCGIYKGCL